MYGTKGAFENLADKHKNAFAINIFALDKEASEDLATKLPGLCLYTWWQNLNTRFGASSALLTCARFVGPWIYCLSGQKLRHSSQAAGCLCVSSLSVSSLLPPCEETHGVYCLGLPLRPSQANAALSANRQVRSTRVCSKKARFGRSLLEMEVGETALLKLLGCRPLRSSDWESAASLAASVGIDLSKFKSASASPAGRRCSALEEGPSVSSSIGRPSKFRV